MKTRALICVVVTVLYFICKVEGLTNKKLIVLLVDGFRWDLINDPKLKGIRRIVENGVKAPYVIPVYPSWSYTNIYTLVTGLYPESHGFINNLLYEPDTDSFFGMLPYPGATDARWWNGAEPVWITAEKSKRKTALYWWPGCEVEIRGGHPAICERQRYGPVTKEQTADFLERIDDVVQMFNNTRGYSSYGLSLALMYYGSVDYAGHLYGSESAEVKEALYNIDDILYQLQNKMQKAGLQDEVNIMVISDHGMTDINGNFTKDLSMEQFASKIKYQVNYGPNSMILPEDKMLEKLYQEIKNEFGQGLHVYKKEEIPERYHLKHSKRMLPILLVAKKGFYIEALNDSTKRLGFPPEPELGDHGYDPEDTEDIRTIFIATGPDFQKGVETEILHTTDIYNVMCSVLDLEPLPNNGSFERVKSMLL